MSRLIYVVIVIVFLDLFIQLPIITPFAMSLGATEYVAGFIVAIYSFFNIFGNIIGGFFADKIGRRRLLYIAMGGQVIILLMYVFVPNIFLLVILRSIHGFTSGLLTPAAFSLVADISKKATVGRSMAFTGVAIGTAAVIGPAMGGIISSVASYQTVYLVTAIIFLLSIIIIRLVVRESTTRDSRKKHYETNFLELLLRPTLIFAYISAFTLMISNGSLAFGLPLKTDALGLDDTSTGLLLSVFGITAIVVFATPLNRMYSKIKPEILVTIGIFIIGLSMILLHFVPTIFTTFLVMVLYGIGFSLVFPSMNKVIALYANMSERGKANGLFYGFFSLGTVAGSYLSGIFATYFQLPFVFIGITLILLQLVLMILMRKNRQVI
ncbi:MAG TPA: MFS transporter [Aliicoccus persicus]|uniref:MFS transporter n=1 Tax=Aliicoccus persicus TaxID=930138 RepID=A0A921DXK6_9STAP|nr:MFS transporter [Aliicoccus persicus]